VTEVGGAMDYERAGVVETYRRVRGLPAETLRLWRDLLRDLVSTRGVTRVADVGCGTGRFAGCLKEAFGAPIIGLDPSTRMLAAADRETAVHYAGADAERLPLAAASIDVAFLSMVWHHLRDPRAAVVELARVVRPPGAVFVRTPTVDLLDHFVFLRFFPESRALDERRLPTRAALRALFGAGGFTDVVHRTVEQRMADGPAEYRERVRARGFSSLQQISDEAFARGLVGFETWVASLPAGEPMHEWVDVFVFRR
jgi:ubiquinone/menaquinone biosynthesis C-methylase UbiE